MTILLAALLLSVQSRAAQPKYILDGSVVYCPPQFEAPGVKAMRYFVEGDRFVVRAQRCEARRYVKDDALASRRYVAPNGQVVEENYSAFTLVVVAGDKVRAIELPRFEHRSSAELPLSDVRASGEEVEVFVRARRLTTVNGAGSSESVAWGSVRF